MIPLEVISFLDKSDPMERFSECLDIRDDTITVLCHGNTEGTTLKIKIFEEGTDIIKDSKSLPIDKIAIFLKAKPENNIILFACNSGKNRIASPAQRLADKTNKNVWAPLGTLWCDTKYNMFYINEYKINNPEEDPICDKELQESLWKCFTPSERK